MSVTRVEKHVLGGFWSSYNKVENKKIPRRQIFTESSFEDLKQSKRTDDD